MPDSDFAHAFLAERLAGKPSAVLWAKAHECEASHYETILEEIAAQAFQAWLRANIRPIVADVRWDDLKRDALELLNSAGTEVGP